MNICPRCGDEFFVALTKNHPRVSRCGLFIPSDVNRPSMYIGNHLIDFEIDGDFTIIWVNWKIFTSELYGYADSNIYVEELKWDITLDYINKLILLKE